LEAVDGPGRELRTESSSVPVYWVLTQYICALQSLIRAQIRTGSDSISFHEWFHDGDQLAICQRSRDGAVLWRR
jgi:hypothetical protein